MDSSAGDLFSPWAAWPAGVARTLREVADPAARAQALATLLHSLAPTAQVAACRLDGAGASAPAGVLREAPAGLPLSADGPTPVDLDGGLRGVAVALGGDGGEGGYLLLGWPRDTSPPTLAGVGALLSLAGAVLALRLRQEAERREWEDLITVGEAMPQLAHDLNNSLNSMLMQIAGVQIRAQGELRHELGEVRREGVQAAGRLRLLQRLRDRAARPSAPADLNEAVRAALAADAETARRVRADLAPEVLPVAAAPAPLRRLAQHVLRVGLGLHGPADRPVRLRTLREEGEVRLVVEVDGYRLGPERLMRLTDLPAEDLAGGLGELERAAAQSLARQLDAKVSVAGREEGGATVVVGWGDGATV